jgi:hypothetical protein
MYYDLLYDTLRGSFRDEWKGVGLTADEAYFLAASVIDWRLPTDPRPIDRDPMMLNSPRHGMPGKEAFLGGFNRGETRDHLCSYAEWGGVLNLHDTSEPLVAKIRDGLVEKIRDWSDVQALAVEDALRQYWHLSDPEVVPDLGLLVEVGLLCKGRSQVNPALVRVVRNRIALQPR